ncbi:MAG: hypothetical protein NVS4B3_26120 [Gemmatimonadaceae bacterium]
MTDREQREPEQPPQDKSDEEAALQRALQKHANEKHLGDIDSNRNLTGSSTWDNVEADEGKTGP